MKKLFLILFLATLTSACHKKVTATDISKINWIKEKESVIKRILERGNNLEKEEINRFYNSISN